jgi:hypothetical protein
MHKKHLFFLIENYFSCIQNILKWIKLCCFGIISLSYVIKYSKGYYLLTQISLDMKSWNKWDERKLFNSKWKIINYLVCLKNL